MAPGEVAAFECTFANPSGEAAAFEVDTGSGGGGVGELGLVGGEQEWRALAPLAGLAGEPGLA